MELHRGELVPCYEQPARVDYIRQALQADGHAFSEPRDFGVEVLHAVHDPAFVDFLRTAHARWRDEGRDGSMLPSGFPARSLRRDRIPEGINGAMGYYAFDAGTPIVEGTWDAAFASARWRRSICVTVASTGSRCSTSTTTTATAPRTSSSSAATC
ncbi:hypothetical protein [Luteimonas arsenica]|uniref:hypothetical protein n=1 Tax=Luteimonas arsenica TaxID=1586242 RepID=UPI0024412DB9|nr:hypothetical protein [Luteimonas arsenica]